MLEKNRIFSLVFKKITEREFKTFFRAIALARSSVMRVDSRSRIDFTVVTQTCVPVFFQREDVKELLFSNLHT